MKVLVIGGAGYIGSHVVLELLENKHEVTVFDNLSTGSLGNIFPGTDFVKSDILDTAALEKVFKKGFDVKKNEIHGMSQREGSVVSFIRYGEKVYSPVVSQDEADFLLSFEKLETLRNLNYLKMGGCIVMNSFEIPPTPVKLKLMEYPKEVEQILQKKTETLKVVDALESAKKIGNVKAVNVILLGVLSNYIENIDVSIWEESIKTYVKERYQALNLEAFEIGRRL